MTSRGLAEVLLRVYGVYWLVRALVLLPYLQPLLAQGQWRMLLSPLLTAGMYAVVGGGLIAYGGRWSRRWIAEEAGPGEPLTSQRAQAIAISILGLYFAVAGASYLASNGASFVFEDAGARQVNNVLLERSPGVIAANVVFLLAGLVLFLASSAIARSWHRPWRRAQHKDSGELR